MSRKPAPKQDRGEEPEELSPLAGEELYQPEGLSLGQRHWLAAQERPDDLTDHVSRLMLPLVHAEDAWLLNQEPQIYCKGCRGYHRPSACPLWNR